MIQFAADYFIRDPYPRKLYVYIFGRQINLYGARARIAAKILTKYNNLYFKMKEGLKIKGSREDRGFFIN